MATRHFSNWLDAFVELYADLQAPECYKYWTAMSVIAGTVSRKVWWSTGKLWWYPNLYVFLVGEFSSGKSTVAGKAMDMLREVPDFELGPTEVNSSSLILELKNAGNKRSFEFHGKHYRNSSLFLFASEAVKVFGDMAGKDSNVKTTLVEAFNSGDGPWTTFPVIKRSTRTHGTEEIFNPCINILACSTPEWLMTRIMLRSDVLGGLGSRFLYAVPPLGGQKERRTTIADVSHFEKRNLLVEDLKIIAELKGGFTATQAFIDAYDAYGKEHTERQKLLKFEDEMLFGCTARKQNAQLPKLAMLLALAERRVTENDHLTLEEHHAHKAWGILTELEKTMPLAFGRYGVAEEVQHIHDVLYFITSQERMSVSKDELCRIFAKRHTAKVLTDALYNLCQQNVLEVDLMASKGKNRVYRVVNLPGQMPVSL